MNFDPSTAAPESSFDPATAQPLGAPTPRDVLGVAAKVNPDQAAEAERLAKRYPAPSDVLLRNLTDAKLQAAVDDADAKLTTDVPALRARMTQIPFASQAHDDVGVLSSIEGFVRQTGRSVKSGVYGADRGAAGVFQAGSELVAPLLDFLEADPSKGTGDWRVAMGGNPLRRLAEGFANIGRADAATQASLRPQGPQNNIGAGFFSGVESLTQNLLALPMAFAPGGQGAALTMMTASTGGNSYQDAREKGLGMAQALPFAASQAAIEYATEVIPLTRLLGDVKAGTPIFQTLMRQIGAEIPGEQVATILQDLNEWAVLNPDKPFTSYLQDRPSAAAQTLVATIVGAGGNVAVAQGLEAIMTRAVGQDADLQRNDANLKRFEQLLGAAAESKLRERSPETFAQFVNEAAANTEGAPTAVYVDARALTDALNQAGITDEQLAEVMPSVPAQMAAAFEAGGTVEIPIGEALAAAPGTPIEQVLLQNARLDPEGLSRAEVDEAGKQAEQFVKTEAERVMAQAADREAIEQSADAVRTTILDQLNTAGRFRPEANVVYADMVRAFYATTAQRTGVTPEELYAKYPLRVAAEGAGGLAQEGQTDELTGLPLNADGTVTVYHHTSAANAEAIRKTGKLKAAAEPDVYVTSRKETDTGYGDTAVPIRVKPELLQLDDEFPDGRMDFRIDAGKPGGAVRVQVDETLAQTGTRATFSPEQMLIVLGQNADLSSFLHESGHFFLEVLADLGTQPGAPEQIAKDWATTLRWFGVAPEAWGQMTLDQKRPYHERWAESVEQYFFEGKAPSVELRAVFDRFRTWLTSVYKSLRNFLAMREQSPGGQAAAPGELNQAAYHGTPHRGIEKFSTDKIGTGEGAQAYGWGLYFASKREIAEWYRKNLAAGSFSVSDFDLDSARKSAERLTALTAELEQYARDNPDDAQRVQRRLKADNAALEAAQKTIAEGEAERANPGQLYEVDIPEDDTMLLWDKPLSEQPEAVRKALDLPESDPLEVVEQSGGYAVKNAATGKLVAENFASRASAEKIAAGHSDAWMNQTGAQYYKREAELEGSDKAASEALAALGVKGIKYLDGTSRGAGDGTFNYVVFSGDDVAIKNQFYQSDAPAAGPLGLSDEVRQVMDRLLATDEQIAEAERVRNYGLLFKSPEEAGMTPEQWAAYTSADEKAHADALNELGKKSLKNLGIVMRKRMRALREVQADMAEKRKAVEAEAAEQIAAEPVYQAMRWLKKGEMVTPEGEEIKVTDGFKLDAAAVNAIFPESMVGRPDMAKLKGMTRKTEGMDPAIVAEMFGFRDGAHLITSVVEAFPQADQVQGLTDQLMLERYGEAATPRGMERAADEAVHNENRARVLAAEMTAVSQANNARAPGTGTRTVNAMVEAAKQFAANLVGRKLIKDLKPNVHTAAETRAAKAAEKALAKGDTAGVIQAKRDQLLNFHAARATNDARIEAAKIIGFFKKVATAKDDVVGKTRDIDVVKAAQAVLAAYDVGTKGKAAAEYLAILERNDPAMFAAVKPSLEAALINAKPVDQLTLDELRALNEEVQALWYLAKRSRQMEVDGNLLDRQDIEDDLKARMQVIGIPDSMPGDTSAITPAEQRALKLKGYLATARRVESWARGLDGSGALGPFTRYVWQPVKEAANAYRKDKASYLKAFRDLLKPLEPTLTKRQVQAPELNYTFGKDTDGVALAEMLHALLHTGNESNKRKLLLGRKWATEDEEGNLDTSRWDAFVQRMVNEGILQPVHFDFAQGVWDLLEATKPMAQKAHRDVFGRYFAEVTAQEFTDPFGVKRRGGYVPAQADPRVVSDAATRALAEAENASMQFAFPSTNKGFTKGRVEYNRPLMLDLRSIAQHIDKVLLFSHMEQPVRDVRKVLTAKGVAYGLNRIDPVASDSVLTPWLNRAARQLVATPAPNNWQGWRFWTTVRNRAGMAAMFGNVANAVQQFAGFSLAAVRVKPSQLLGATAQYIANPKQTAEMVASKSSYMDGRLTNEVANMNDAINEILINPNVLEKTQRFTAKHAYFLQSAIDNVVGPIVWTGAYNQALAEGMAERDAIRKADAAVRETQGSTAPEDISAFEEGTPFSRLFTQFAGYFNMQANLLGTEFQTLAREMGLRKGVGRGLYVLTLGFLVNAWVAEAIMQLFKGGPDDEDKDGEFLDDWLKQVFGWSLFRNATAMVPLFGQGINAVANYTNDKPYDDRLATSPAISMLESALRSGQSVYKAIVDDGKVSKAIKDVGTLIALTVGIPLAPITKPLGYVADVEQGKVSPTGPVDAVRGAVTGSPGGEAKR